jgi:serine protease Do
MNAFLDRLRVRRLAFTFTVLATLSAGILIGSVAAHGVKGNEQGSASDAAPLTLPSPQQLSNGFSQIAKQVGPAVVNINTESLPKEQKNPHRRGFRSHAQPSQPQDPQDGGGDGDSQDFQDFFNRFFGGQNPEGPDADGGDANGLRQSLGSGFIVDPKGYIITNNHVVDKADKIYVKLSTDPDGDPGRPAKVVGVDKETDIAVIKIDSNTPLPTVKLGNSDGEQVGDWVLAIGSPFALSQTVTAGIVSAKNRSIQPGAQGQFQHFIQTDAAINPGNSGGPLVNMNGEVIGVNTAIFTQSMGYQGVGFAMPSATVVDVYNDLIGASHKVTRGSIGIRFQNNLSSAVGRVYGFKNGVLISAVDPTSPAATAGLKAGDIITGIDGHSIKDGDELVSIVSARKPGSKIQMTYLRDGKQENATVGIADRAELIGARNNARDDEQGGTDKPDVAQNKLGVTVKSLAPEVSSRIGVKGAQIVSVKPGSFADEQGLAPGLVITAVNKKPVTNEQDFRNIVGGLKSGDDVVFTIVDPRAPKDSGGTYVGGTLP